ncbi:MAG: SPOR domain-containing protein [Saprospiraceae bacterium]
MRKADWIVAALIAAIFILGIYFFNKNWPDVSSQEHDRPSVAETLDKIGDGKTATLDEEDEYDEEGDFPHDSDTTTYEPEEPTVDDLADLNETRAAEAGGEATGRSNSNTNTRPSAYDNANSLGKYLVVAGTFKQEVNAQIQLKKFKQMGYDNAEIGKFNKKAYASLIVNRFASAAEAKQLVNTLKRKGIEAYVHTKR